MYKILTDQEIHSVLEQAKHYGRKGEQAKWTTLMMLLANYGPRISEALRLTWDQFDAERKTLTMQTLKRKKPTTRTILLHDGMVKALQDYHATVNGDARIFPAPRHGRTIAWRAFQTMLIRAGIPRVKLHSLRHSSCTRWFEIDPILARDIHGHANISTTNAYLHAKDIQKKYAVVQPII